MGIMEITIPCVVVIALLLVGMVAGAVINSMIQGGRDD